MIIPLGALAFSWFGYTIFKESRDQEPDPAGPAARSAPDAEKTALVPTAEERAEEHAAEEDADRKADHYVDTAAAGMGVAMLSVPFPALRLLSAGLSTYNVVPALTRSRDSLKEKKLTYDTLVSTYIVVGLASGFLCPIALGQLIYALSVKLVKKTQQRSRRQISNTFDQCGRTARILVDGEPVEVEIDVIQPEDTVVVAAGEVIPVDGKIVVGSSLVEQHSLTGEYHPAEKVLGDRVLASTMVLTGSLEIRVEETGRNTTVAKIEETLLKTADFKSTVQSRGEKWADQAVAPVLGLAVLAYPVLGVSSALVALNTSYGSRIRVLAPLGVLSYLTVALRRGLLIKDGRALELARDVDTVVFDKTGTLTEERPRVGRILSANGHRPSDILACAAAAERHIEHPIAHSILEQARRAELWLPPVEDARYELGLGVTVAMGGDPVRVGSHRFMTDEGVKVNGNLRESLAEGLDKGYSSIFVARGCEVMGAIEIRPHLRPEAPAVVEQLRASGVQHVAIISGDHEEPTRHLARQLGADEYHHSVLPHEKARIIEEYRAAGRTICYVGDGINDSIAMKASEVSVSLRGASSIATDTASVLLMDGNLNRLPDLLELSGKLDKNLNRSLYITVAPSVLNVVGLFAFGLGLTGSILIKAVSFLFGLGNAMSARLEAPEGEPGSAGELSEAALPPPAAGREPEAPIAREIGAVSFMDAMTAATTAEGGNGGGKVSSEVEEVPDDVAPEEDEVLAVRA